MIPAGSPPILPVLTHLLHAQVDIFDKDGRVLGSSTWAVGNDSITPAAVRGALSHASCRKALVLVCGAGTVVCWDRA